MKIENLKVRIKKDISNLGGQTLHKGDLVAVKNIWSNESNTTLFCEVEKDDVLIFTKLKDIV